MAYWEGRPLPEVFTRGAAIDHGILVPAKKHTNEMNCFDCGRLAVLPANFIADGGKYGRCSKCGGVVGRIYGITNDFPKDPAAATFAGSLPSQYRISPCFIAIFSDDVLDGCEVHPCFGNYRNRGVDVLRERFKDRITKLTPYGWRRPPDPWQFLAECPFVGHYSRYHAWRRIAMGEFEELTDDDRGTVWNSAQIAGWWRCVYDQNLQQEDTTAARIEEEASV